MPLIKVRDSSEPVKTHRKGSVITSHIRNTYTRTKEQSQRMKEDAESSPSEYASDNAQYIAENVIQDGGHLVQSGTEAALRKGQEVYQKHQLHNKHGDAVSASPPDHIPNSDGMTAAPTEHKYNPIQSREALEKARASQRFNHPITQAEKLPVRTATTNRPDTLPEVPSKIAVKGHSSPAQRTIAQVTPKRRKRDLLSTHKGVRASVKTGRTSNVALKSVKATQKTADTTYRTAKVTTMAAKKLAQAASATVKATSKFLVSSIKAAIAGTKALVAAIAAGGWIAVIAIVIICLIGLIVSSSFGIFFSSEDTGSSQTMQEVVQEINDEYVQKLDSIKSSVTYDELEMAGSRAVWPEVLAIYAVQTTSNSDNPQEVATITDEKVELLQEIFWQMNEISYETATVTEMELIETDDGNGNIVEEWHQVVHTYLYVTVSHKTAAEIAAALGFNDDQLKQLEELLATENATLWTSVLYGITATDGQIITVALSQIGNVGGEPYWSWYGFNARVEWCACFVSWCANECGYIDAGIIPKFASCVNGVSWFKERGQWMDNSADPTPGMIIFFDWDKSATRGPDGRSDHVGIVEKVESGRVYTIEGNSGDACKQRSYPLGHYEILGYGIPAY